MNSFINNHFNAYEPERGGSTEGDKGGCRNRMFSLIGAAGFVLATSALSRIILGGGSDGVNAQQYQDGTTHVTVYRQEQSGKGKRISFDHNQSGDVSQVHSMNQNTREYQRGSNAIDDYYQQ